MRQTRLSIGCQDWQEIVRTIGPEAAGVLVYLRTLMRSMQASEISITVSELAKTLRIPSERAETALAAISPRYLERTDAAGGVITLRSPEEAKAMAERRRKQAAKIATKCLNGNSARTSPGLRKFAAPLANEISGNSENTSEIPKNEAKTYHADFFMRYDGSSREKDPQTPQKEKSLTEHQALAHSRAPVQEPEPKASSGRGLSTATRVDDAELPGDELEAEFIEMLGSWPKSLRDALKAEPNDVREVFYLYIRTRQDNGERWTADRIRIAWLAARRIPADRRAESILAASMGNWKTIRDAGSGCYFEKGTGKIVSLVRGPVEYSPKNATEKTNAELAVRLARSMRRD